MGCPKCGSRDIAIEGAGTTTIGPKGEFIEGVEFATGVHCYGCNSTSPLPSKPFWETVIEKAGK